MHAGQLEGLKPHTAPPVTHPDTRNLWETRGKNAGETSTVVRIAALDKAGSFECLHLLTAGVMQVGFVRHGETSRACSRARE